MLGFSAIFNAALRPAGCARQWARPSQNVAMQAVTIDVLSVEPIIVAMDGLCLVDRVESLRQAFEESGEGSRERTHDYQEDVFDEAAKAAEDAHILHCIKRVGVEVADLADPLRVFLTIAGKRPGIFTDAEMVQAARTIQRRKIRSKWESTPEGRQLLKSNGFVKPGRRWKMPQAMLSSLWSILPRVFGCSVKGNGSDDLHQYRSTTGFQWTLCDATVVQYDADESQVIHLDSCDATLLVYLNEQEGDQAGGTYFPLLEQRVKPLAGRVLLFFSTVFSPGSDCFRARSLDMAALHCSEVVQKEKLVAQLMFNACIPKSASSWWDGFAGLHSTDVAKPCQN